MNFLDYPHYVIGCLGVGDIICSLNALENIGRERDRRLNVYVVHQQYFKRVATLYSDLELPHIDLHLCQWPLADIPSDDVTVFQAFGNDVSWVKAWPYGWGLRQFVGEEHMVLPKTRPQKDENLVGVSFTVVSNPAKNISPESTIKIIDGVLNEGRRVMYFGYRGDTDHFLKDHYGDRISYAGDLAVAFAQVGTCGSFIGADSGMAWLAAFQRVPTRIVIGHSLPVFPSVFRDISWVTIEREP